MLTTDAVARLLHSIIGGVAVSSDRSLAMMELLKRNLNSEVLDCEENQITGFLGAGKTTTLKEILNNLSEGKNAVIMNEFGRVGIDGKLLDSFKKYEFLTCSQYLDKIKHHSSEKL